MKFLGPSYQSTQNNDDTLIGKLMEMDDSITQRSFGVELHNRPYEVYSIKKKNQLTKSELRTNEQQQLFCDEFKTDTGDISQIEKDYRISILMNLIQDDFQATSQKNYKPQRNMIVNWLVLIHSRYPFEPETLHEAVRIFDRFITLRQIEVQDYQKYALTAYWMSAKMEERKVKQLKLWITFGKGYMLSQILQSEKQIFQALEFKLVTNTAQKFLYSFATFFPLAPRVFILCNYLLQLTLLSSSYSKYPSSIVALGCLFVCIKVLRKDISIKVVNEVEKMSSFLKLSSKLLQECSKRICRTLQSASTNPLNSVFRKYSSRRYLQIALIKLGRA